MSGVASSSRVVRALHCSAHTRQAPRTLLSKQCRSFSYSSARLQIQSTKALGVNIDDKTHKTINRMVDLHDNMPEAPEAGDEEDGLRLMIFGKPGSGKGTLSARLVQKYDISFVSTGDVLRREIMNKSEVGKKAEAIVARGGLVPDELMLEVVKTELDRLRGKSWIIDGFPRTLHQGELLDRVLNEEGRPLNVIIHLNVPDSIIMARIAARWVHLPSGRVYNDMYSAPKVAGHDDVTGEPLSKRPDDNPETFSKRLEAFYESTAPLLDYFNRAYPGSLFSISGSTSDEVHAGSASDESSETLVKGPDDNTAVDQLWPKLEDLLSPFGLRRRKALDQDQVETVRAEADDLKGKT